MNISGIQKLTLLDFPGKLACTVFTSGCNFRCPFCHNASLVLPGMSDHIDEQEVFSFLKKREGILEGVCITGGEPCLQPDLETFIRKVRDIGFAVKLDTNGSFPEKLSSLLEKGLLDYVAMDIKTSKERYPEVCGVQNERLFENVQKSVEILKSSSVPHEFRTTTARELQTKEDFEKIGRWLSGEKRYFIQQYEASGELVGDEMTPYEKEELTEFAKVMKNFVENVEIRGI
ncbi:MAG: anaerobic ribonucleoside-triphosphate reductase activating protein [Oscillospiraceae bacterium]|nr:anaerobic ribonucleoside-triphosphate reductase activating protein [Oscillospiraceae bacterium]MDD7293371.1 anaerobic ribonucleoside-triphosphate reductase activating protein [Clostridiaceae bacterium]